MSVLKKRLPGFSATTQQTSHTFFECDSWLARSLHFFQHLRVYVPSVIGGWPPRPPVTNQKEPIQKNSLICICSIYENCLDLDTTPSSLIFHKFFNSQDSTNRQNRNNSHVIRRDVMRVSRIETLRNKKFSLSEARITLALGYCYLDLGSTKSSCKCRRIVVWIRSNILVLLRAVHVFHG